MNYQKIYDRIVQRAKFENREKGKDIYYEAHHIIPKCLGGTGRTFDWKWHDNIVLLTAKEHFICHRLLHTIYPNNIKLQFAFEMMCFVQNDRQRPRYVPSSRVIEEARNKIKSRNKELGKLKIGKKYPKLSESKKGFKFSDESVKKMSIAQINMSKEKRENISRSQRNFCWITDGIVDRRHPKDKDIPLGFFKGRSWKKSN